MANPVQTIIYKSLTGASLPFYKAGALKSFQLNGNYKNFNIDLIQTDDATAPTFITPFVPYTVTGVASTLKLYEIDASALAIAETYEDFIACRGNYTSLAVTDISKESKETTYQRYYCNGFVYEDILDAGIYELVLTDSDGKVFESELFSVCLFKETTFPQIICSNAACPDIEVGEHPEFSIDVSETNRVNVRNCKMTVTWNMGTGEGFPYTLPMTFGDEGASYTTTYIFDLDANETKSLEFTYRYYPNGGEYSVTYRLNYGNCEDTIEFTVGNPCINFVSGTWSVPDGGEGG